MLRVFLIIISISLIYWLTLLKKKKVFKRKSVPKSVVTKIEGYECQAVLGLETPLECLRDDGVRFGNKFQKKNVPELPHSEQCKCESVPLFYTSSDIFQGGAGLSKTSRKTCVGSLDAPDAQLLRQMLLGLYTYPLPVNFEAFCHQFEDGFSESVREELLALLEKGYQQGHSSDNSSS